MVRQQDLVLLAREDQHEGFRQHQRWQGLSKLMAEHQAEIIFTYQYWLTQYSGATKPAVLISVYETHETEQRVTTCDGREGCCAAAQTCNPAFGNQRVQLDAWLCVIAP